MYCVNDMEGQKHTFGDSFFIRPTIAKEGQVMDTFAQNGRCWAKRGPARCLSGSWFYVCLVSFLGCTRSLNSKLNLPLLS
jgi:hypothetical protein